MILLGFILIVELTIVSDPVPIVIPASLDSFHVSVEFLYCGLQLLFPVVLIHRDRCSPFPGHSDFV